MLSTEKFDKFGYEQISLLLQCKGISNNLLEKVEKVLTIKQLDKALPKDFASIVKGIADFPLSTEL
jgi:hypothetical protein